MKTEDKFRKHWKGLAKILGVIVGGSALFTGLCFGICNDQRRKIENLCLNSGYDPKEIASYSIGKFNSDIYTDYRISLKDGTELEIISRTGYDTIVSRRDSSKAIPREEFRKRKIRK